MPSAVGAVRVLPATLVVGAVGLAGVFKAADLALFRQSLESWTLIPSVLRPSLAIGIPLVEILVAGLWFIRAGRLRAYAAVGFLLVAFSSVYSLHVWLLAPPDCNCLGILDRFEQSRHAMSSIVGRNAVLLGLWFAGWLLSESTLRRADADRARIGGDVGARGFTLIETILVVALAGILAALTLPVLGGARERAERVGNLSAMRQHAAVFAAYVSDWSDYYPAYARPDATLHVIRSAQRTLTYRRYFDTNSGWNVALADLYYGGRSDGADFQRRRLPETVHITSFYYASCFMAKPEFWNPESRSGPEQWGPVTAAQVQWPSSKVLLLDYWRWVGSPPLGEAMPLDTDVSLVDGSARSAVRNDFLPPYLGGEGDWPGSAVRIGIPGFHTIDGVRGRDFR